MGENRISELTLREKTLLTIGNGAWHTHAVGQIPAVMMTDGPHGLRKQKDGAGINDSNVATCFPTACAVASSWNVQNAQKIAQCIAEEAIAENVSVVLGPGINIKRSPLCGRNFEYFSEDPHLAGSLGAAYVNAMQQKNVGCCVKHFAVNSQETRRMTVDALVDERALREIYLSAFEQVITQSKPWSVMASYNKVNGHYATQNKYLLTDVLRNEWKFDGVVMSDWGASYDTPLALQAGMDLEMPEDPSDYHRQRVENSVKNGTLPETFLDRACQRIANFVDKCSVDKTSDNDLIKHHSVCREVAADSAVLLKNNGLLPLAKDADICIIGELAEKPRFQGAGSSHINAVCKSFLQVLAENGLPVHYSKGYRADTDKPSKKLENKAVQLAKTHKTVVFFGGLTDMYEGEGYDRTHLEIPQNQQILLDKLFEVNPRIVFVAVGGSPFEMPWLNKVQSLLDMYLGGQAVTEATFDLLFGDVSPSGRLAETFPLQLADTLCHNYFANDRFYDAHCESIFVGYRYYNTLGKAVLFPFGYGLSYSEFQYSNLEIVPAETGFEVDVTVKNVGSMAASEVVQLYVDNNTDGILRPKRELRGFAKVHLAPDESQTVHFSLTQRDFSVYKVGVGFVAVNGDYGISVCKNVEETLLTRRVSVNFGESFETEQTVSEYFLGGAVQENFYRLWGGQKREKQLPKRGEFTLLNTFEDLMPEVGLIRLMSKFIKRIAVKNSQSKSFNSPEAKMIWYGAMETPLISLMSVGGVPAKYVKFLLYHANKQRRKAWRALFGKYEVD